jgi:sugar/nucleoside kinase (ribokinase family)
MPERIVVYGYLSIDTLVTGAGRHDGVPGGAALYAALGARAAGGKVTGVRVAIRAAVGEDYPADWLAGLAALGLDVSGVVRRPGPTRRARITHADNGGRASPHHDEAIWWERTAALAPPTGGEEDGDEDSDDLAVIAPMPFAAAEAIAKRHGSRAVLDLSEAFARQDAPAWLELAGALTCFAPSREETRLLLPGLDDDAALRRLAAGGSIVVQKRGAEGLALAGRDGITRIAPPAVQPVDPTGAGDATVGALAARLAAGDDTAEAARAAVVIGARTVERLGPSALGLHTHSSP